MLEDSIQHFLSKLGNGWEKKGHSSIQTRRKYHTKPETITSKIMALKKNIDFFLTNVVNHRLHRSKSTHQKKIQLSYWETQIGIGYMTQSSFLLYSALRMPELQNNVH